MTTTFDPLGTGLSCPFRWASSNDFATATGSALVKSDLGQLLGIDVGELPWRFDAGTTLSRLRHKLASAAIAELARGTVEQAMRKFEPRATVLGVTLEPVARVGDTTVEVHVDYRIGSSAKADKVKVQV